MLKNRMTSQRGKKNDVKFNKQNEQEPPNVMLSLLHSFWYFVSNQNGE
jgi:hypothetical protein